MSLEWPGRASSLAWSNPLAWWWSLLALVSGANIAIWFWLYRYLQQPRTGGLGLQILPDLCPLASEVRHDLLLRLLHDVKPSHLGW